MTMRKTIKIQMAITISYSFQLFLFLKNQLKMTKNSKLVTQFTDWSIVGEATKIPMKKLLRKANTRLTMNEAKVATPMKHTFLRLVQKVLTKVNQGLVVLL